MNSKIDLRYGTESKTFRDAIAAYTALAEDRIRSPQIYSHRYGAIVRSELAAIARLETLEKRHNSSQGL